MWINRKADAATITCRVYPGSPRDLIDSVRDDHLIVRLSAPPVEGKANKALIKLLAKALHIAPSRITIIQGEASRIKVLAIEDMEPDTVLEKLGIQG